MKSLKERQADRAERSGDLNPVVAQRDSLQADAEAMVAFKDKEAGVKSAPLASQAKAKKAKPEAPQSPFAQA